MPPGRAEPEPSPGARIDGLALMAALRMIRALDAASQDAYIGKRNAGVAQG